MPFPVKICIALLAQHIYMMLNVFVDMWLQILKAMEVEFLECLLKHFGNKN